MGILGNFCRLADSQIYREFFFPWPFLVDIFIGFWFILFLIVNFPWVLGQEAGTSSLCRPYPASVSSTMSSIHHVGLNDLWSRGLGSLFCHQIIALKRKGEGAPLALKMSSFSYRYIDLRGLMLTRGSL